MIRNLIFIGLIVLLASAIILITGCGGSATTEDPAAGTQGTETANDSNNTGEETMMVEKRYSCPMDEHNKVFTDPNAKCPECGMDVVEMNNDMNGGHDMEGGMGDMHGDSDGHGQ